jgi:hypothetical protein
MRQFFFISALIGLFIGGVPSFSAFGNNEPQKVYTGIYLMNVYDLDVNEYSFYADFYLWFKWKGERDPTNIEFVNSIEKWGFTQTMFHDTALVLPDGYSYNGMRVEGRFYYSFALSRFPLDRHSLDIRLENIIYPIDSLVYVPEQLQLPFNHQPTLELFFVETHAPVNRGDLRQSGVFIHPSGLH